ncbi:MAG TPA: thermosome subunit, partial [Candidatus Methanomethylia archaeon]|nr:thermosome subunit [Candidatus Methanomethylicia archaeon]
GRIVGGGGACEMEAAKHIREYAASVGGREQLAIEAFADALEIIPRTLAENAGLDPIDILVELRSLHERGEVWAGIDVFKGKPANMVELGVIEPLAVKTHATRSAVEAAAMILRIDDIIAASKTESKPKVPEKPSESGAGEFD